MKKVIDECLGLKPKESLLLVCDDKSHDLALSLYKGFRQMRVKAIIITMPVMDRSGQEPPVQVKEALNAADTALLITTHSLSHTKARKEACKAHGTRIASLPGITRDIFMRSVDVDYKKMAGTVNHVSGLLTKGKRLEVFTDLGTQLTMDIGNRKGFLDTGIYRGRGRFGNLPAGEACIGPIEGTTNGVLVVDGSEPVNGRVKRPVKIEIKNGYVVKMPFKHIENIIKPLGRDAYAVAELGIGLNPKARITGNVLEDEKARRTAHLAIGNNESFGGHIYCTSHIDFVFLDPKVFIDGTRLFIK